MADEELRPEDAARTADAVEIVREDDGSVTARDLLTGLERGGSTRASALSNLAEVLLLRESGGTDLDDPEAFLEDAGVNPVQHVDTPSWEQ